MTRVINVQRALVHYMLEDHKNSLQQDLRNKTNNIFWLGVGCGSSRGERKKRKEMVNRDKREKTKEREIKEIR